MTRIISLLLFIVLPIGIFAADFDDVLKKIGSYDYGDSRENLTTLSEMLRKISGDALKLTEYEKAMLELLAAKETTFAAKQYLCKELSIMGTEQSVPTLAKLLQKEETADIARYALERIPGDKVDATLLVAMQKTKGKVRVGVINTIGERQIKAATPYLGQLLTNKDTDIAMAAAAALGKIATDESATLLGSSLLKLDGQVRNVAVDAYLKNADVFFNAGDKAKAEAIYEPLFAETESVPTRSAALTGLIKTVDNPSNLIVQILQKDENPTVKAVAISSVHQCERDMDLPAIAAAMANLDALGQIQLLTAFRIKGNPVVRDAVAKAVDSDDEDVSIAAIQALAVIGDKMDAERLAMLAASSTGDKKEIIKEALARLNADGTNEAIITAIPNADAKTKVELVESIGERLMTASIPTLLDAARDENVRVRVAALKALSQVSSPADINALIDLLINAQSDAERRESERMVVAVATKIDDKNKQGDAVLDAIKKVDDIKTKSSLMLVAGSIGDPDALPILRQALSSEDNEIKRAAILSLSEWPTPEPLKDLQDAAGAAAEPSQKVLALRGYIRLIGLESDRAKPETVALYKTALDLATDAGEKRMALSGLGKVRCPAAMFLAAEYLDDPELKGEAEIAVMENSWSTGDADRDKVKAVLQKVYENTDDERLKRGAKQMLDQFNQ